MALIVAVATPSLGDCGQLEPPETLQEALAPHRITREIVVRATTAKEQYEPLERIRVAVEVENVSDTNGWVPGGINVYHTYKLTAYDGTGNLLPEALYNETHAKGSGMVGASGGSCGAHFAVGEVLRGELVANLVHDMTRPGAYTILVEFQTWHTRKIDGETVRLVAQSTPLRVEVSEEPLQFFGNEPVPAVTPPAPSVTIDMPFTQGKSILIPMFPDRRSMLIPISPDRR